MTADRPTGKMHIGHFVGSFQTRVELQNKGEYDKFYIMIADVQALTDNAGNPQKVRDNIVEIMLDYLSVGLDPNKVVFCLQSQIPALAEMAQYFSNLVTFQRLVRNPTVKSEIKFRGFDNESVGIPVGFVCYPISQTADICAFGANLIPVGEDQEPMLEQQREIVRSFNRTYHTNCLVECKSCLSQNVASRRLPGTDGKEKMSKSLGNCIYLCDEPDEIKKKVNSIKTFPRKIEEPGILQDNVLFAYLSAFCKDEHFAKYYPKFKYFDELKTTYKKGGIGDGEIKKFLNSVLQETLQPIRARRAEYQKDIHGVLQILEQGTQKANQAANATLKAIKNAMGIDYFDDPTFEAEQTKLYSKN